MKRLAWPVALPPMVGGVVAAHALAFRLTVPSETRGDALEETGHAWFAYLPLVAGACAAVLVLGVAQRLLRSERRRPAAWPFAFFPPLALLLQEQLERGQPALDWTIAAGILLAVPLGLAAYALLRALLGIVDSLAGGRRPPTLALSPLVVASPRAEVASRAYVPPGARGPPRNVR